MNHKRYTEERIIAVLKQQEAGVSVPYMSTRHGIAGNTISPSKSKFGGMEVSEAKRLRAAQGREPAVEEAPGRCRARQGRVEGAGPRQMVTALPRRRAMEHLNSRR